MLLRNAFQFTQSDFVASLLQEGQVLPIWACPNMVYGHAQTWSCQTWSYGHVQTW